MNGFNINSRCCSKNSTILLALLANKIYSTNIIKYLLSQGADPNISNDDKYTPMGLILLIENINENSFEIINLLITYGVGIDVNQACCSMGFTSLKLAAFYIRCSAYYIDIIKLLITHGADPNLDNSIFGSPLNLILCTNLLNYSWTEKIETKIFDVVETLLANGANPNIIEHSGNALHNSIFFDHSIHIIKLLIKYGVDLDAKSIRYPMMTSLQLLMCNRTNFLDPSQIFDESEKFDKIKLLIESGSNINDLYNNSDTLLHLATSNINESSYKIVELLLNLGLDPNAKTKYYDSTPLHLLLISNYLSVKIKKTDKDIKCGQEKNRQIIEILKLLISNGANVNIKTGEKHEIILFDIIEIFDLDIQKEIVQLLLDNNIDINSINDQGDNILSKAIHFACAIAYINKQNTIKCDFLQFLVEKGVDTNLIYPNGKTLLMVTIENSHKYKNLKILDIIKLLIGYGADTNITDNNGKTAIDYTEDEEMKQILYESNEPYLLK